VPHCSYITADAALQHKRLNSVDMQVSDTGSLHPISGCRLQAQLRETSRLLG
jgi:hypothetical protein